MGRPDPLLGTRTQRLPAPARPRPRRTVSACSTSPRRPFPGGITACSVSRRTSACASTTSCSPRPLAETLHGRRHRPRAAQARAPVGPRPGLGEHCLKPCRLRSTAKICWICTRPWPACRRPAPRCSCSDRRLPNSAGRQPGLCRTPALPGIPAVARRQHQGGQAVGQRPRTDALPRRARRLMHHHVELPARTQRLQRPRHRRIAAAPAASCRRRFRGN